MRADDADISCSYLKRNKSISKKQPLLSDVDHSLSVFRSEYPSLRIQTNSDALDGPDHSVWCLVNKYLHGQLCGWLEMVPLVLRTTAEGTGKEETWR